MQSEVQLFLLNSYYRKTWSIACFVLTRNCLLDTNFTHAVKSIKSTSIVFLENPKSSLELKTDDLHSFVHKRKFSKIPLVEGEEKDVWYRLAEVLQ